MIFEVVGRSAVVEVGVAHDSDLLQGLKGAVHRRGRKGGAAVVGNRRPQLLGRAVSVSG